MNAQTAPAENADSINKYDVLLIDSYGVQIRFELGAGIERRKIKERLNQILPGVYREIGKIEEINTERCFRLTKNPDSSFNVAENESQIIERLPEATMFDLLDNRVRLIVAEHAVGRVFLHAGVVGWKDRAIVIPAKSFQGKTTLVAELVKKGAVYFSDEYAVIDEDGMVHPFPKMLSMRGIIDDFQQVDIPVEKFGGCAGNRALPVGMILLTEYNSGARWKPRKISPGKGMLEILAHTLPIRNKPEFTIKALNNMMNRAIITKTKRGDAALTADLIIGYFEKSGIKS